MIFKLFFCHILFRLKQSRTKLNKTYSKHTSTRKWKRNTCMLSMRKASSWWVWNVCFLYKRDVWSSTDVCYHASTHWTVECLSYSASSQRSFPRSLTLVFTAAGVSVLNSLPSWPRDPSSLCSQKIHLQRVRRDESPTPELQDHTQIYLRLLLNELYAFSTV